MAFFVTGFTLRLLLVALVWTTLEAETEFKFCGLFPRSGGPRGRLAVVFGDRDDAAALERSSSAMVPVASNYWIVRRFMELADFRKVRALALLMRAVGWSSTGRTPSTNSMKDSLASQSRSIRLMMARTKLSFGMKEPRRRNCFKLFLSMQSTPDLSSSSYSHLRLYLGVAASSCFSSSYLRANLSS